MVRFLCFLSPIAHHRSKKVARSSSESMSMNTQENYQDQATNSENNASNTSVDHEGCWQSEDLNGNFCPNESKNLIQMGRLKKSQSLGSVLDNRRGFSVEDITEDNDVDQEFAFDFSHEDKIKKVGDSIDEMHPPEVDIHHDDHHKVVEFFDSIANPSHHESIFSIGVPEQFNGELNGDVKEHFTDPFVEHLPLPSNALPVFAKSRSLTNLGMDTASSNEDVLAHELSRPQSRSFEDMRSLEEGRDESLNGDGTICSETTCKRHITSHLDGKGSHVHVDSVDECILSKTNGEFNEVLDHEREHKYLSGMFQWREFEPNGVEIKEKFQLDSSVQNWGELTSEEFNIKRIEQWISQINIQENCVYEEIGESSHPAPKKDPKVVSGVTTAMPGPSSPSMELAYNYISTLTATSSSAQMSNLGLVAVPFLGVFVSLRVLNLSNNAIVRITSGVLPRGLHMLNLSKNNISAIEGLRDLTRLRVLDLSYNRIVRIGHGLASCSSIKELYLAGNKISEVDGLHRLLKLNVLDLRFNKISTVKGLGQLAANYGTLQAINLEGNPAQRNVGEDQLKKHLLSLLPHLAYYNKHAIKASSSKEILERPPRSITSHPMDRGMRTEQHRSRRGAPASNHSRASRAASSSSKHSRGQHGHLPPTGARGSSNRLPEILLKVVSTPSNNNSIRRSQSVGTL